MALPKAVIGHANLEKAFHRLVRGGNKDYKQFFRHLYPSYDQALAENLEALKDRLTAG